MNYTVTKVNKLDTPFGEQPAGYPKVAIIWTVLFSFYVVTWYLELGKRVSILGQIRFEFILGCILICGAVISIIRAGEFSRTQGLAKYVMLYFVVVALQVVFTEDFSRSSFVFVDRILKFSCMTLFIVAFVKSPFHLRVFIGSFMLSCMKIGQEGLVGKITGNMVWENQGVMRLHGPPGTLVGHPNSLAGNALGTIPFIYYLFPLAPKLVKVAFLIQVLFAANIILFTGSRTGYLGFLIMCLVMFLRSSAKKKFVICAALAALLILPLLPQQYTERFSTTFVGKEKEGQSKAERLEILGDSLEVFTQHPLGVGLGAFRTVRMLELHKIPMDTHNLYTEILTETGIQGFVVFTLLILTMLSQLRKVERSLLDQTEEIRKCLNDTGQVDQRLSPLQKHYSDLLFMRGVCSSVLLFIVTRLSVGFFGHDLYEIYWWFGVGLTISLTNMDSWAKKRTAEMIGDVPQ